MVKDRYPFVPILLMSAGTELDDCSVGNVFLRKPSEIRLLSSVVADLCIESREAI
jgi:hypothetical protein